MGDLLLEEIKMDIAEYNQWIEDNEVMILENYIEQLDINDVPDEYIQNLYESIQEG